MGFKKLVKLVAIGNTSLAIIIPKPWLEYYELVKGDKLEIISNGVVIKIKKVPEGIRNG